MSSSPVESTSATPSAAVRGKVVAVLTPQELADFLPGERLERLKALAPDLTIIDPTGLTEEQHAELLAKYDPEVLIACWKTPSLHRGLPPNLRYVCYLAGSIRKLVTREQIEAGLLVTNWGNSISRTISECALMMILDCLRGVNAWVIDMHQKGAWKTPQTRTFSLFDRRVGIHGFGRISQALVELLRPFNVQISTLSPSVPDELLEKFGVRRANSLEELFSGSEIIVELAALTERTRHSVREEHLRMIPEPGVFVNVGRGAVVEPQGLLNVAREGRLQIALDVYEEEPLPADSPLRGLRNVLLLPHLGGPTWDKRRDAGAHALDNLAAYAAGQPLTEAITPRGYDLST
ncbi:MAG: hydroxyacid dehydrogenase [Verrucomicrobia bacterium]|nr:MAG: hydroxyacid dehydrogenase [Verrucomicrobiota bacterium]